MEQDATGRGTSINKEADSSPAAMFAFILDVNQKKLAFL